VAAEQQRERPAAVPATAKEQDATPKVPVGVRGEERMEGVGVRGGRSDHARHLLTTADRGELEGSRW